MKFQITEACLLKGQHIDAGQVVDVSEEDAGALRDANRGYPLSQAQLDAIARADAEAKAKADAEAKGKTDTDAGKTKK